MILELDLLKYNCQGNQSFSSNYHLYPLELPQFDQGQTIEARKPIYDSLKDNCSAILFCVPRECHRDEEYNELPYGGFLSRIKTLAKLNSSDT